MSKICVNCGGELEEHAVFCDECGTKQPDIQIQQQQIPLSEKRSKVKKQNVDGVKKSKIGLISFILGLISICTFGCLIILDFLGLIFSIISLKKNIQREYAIAGLVMSIVSILLIIVVMILA